VPTNDPAYAKAHYEANKPAYKARARRHTTAHRIELRRVIDEAKSVPCTDCRQSYPPYVMDFDHVRGEKYANIADMVVKQVSLKRLLEEIAKCEVVCANCHRERTHGGGGRI
jgi:hypothetical protein